MSLAGRPDGNKIIKKQDGFQLCRPHRKVREARRALCDKASEQGGKALANRLTISAPWDYALPMRIMGLDVGDRTVGVAMSDELGITAQGVEVIRRAGLSRDLEALKDLARRYSVHKVVYGLPINMDGTEGPQAEKTRNFAEEAARAIGVPAVPWDERLSTVASERILIEADLSRKKRRQVVDKVAAAYILQSYLDSPGARDDFGGKDRP